MIVRWDDKLREPNDAGFPQGWPCSKCGEPMPHEEVEFFAVSDGRYLNVKSIQTHGKFVRITLDA